MSEATNRVLEAQLRRQKQNDKRQKEWETALKPTTIDGSGVLRQLGQQPLDNRQILPNTASLNRPIRPTSVPGGVVADWLPRIKKVEPEVGRKIPKTPPPGNWAIVFSNFWRSGPAATVPEPAAVTMAEALLRFIGAVDAGIVQYRSISSVGLTRETFDLAASNLEITVDDSSDLVGTLTKDYPIVSGGVSGDVLLTRDRTARWGSVVLSTTTTINTLFTFLRVMQVASPEAIAATGSNPLIDIGGKQPARMELNNDPESPFSRDVLGMDFWTVGPSFYTGDSLPILIPDNIFDARFDQSDSIPAFPRSRLKNSISPKQLCYITSGLSSFSSGFFSQVNTTFPAPVNYKRLP